LGTSSGGLLAGYVYDHTHQYSVAFALDLAIAASALLLLLVSRETTRSNAETKLIEAETAVTPE
jgi:predicted MFS family arabinose efflux permease